MFTGIVEEVGRITELEASGAERRFTISAAKVFDAVEVGDSVAVNGVCLTAVATSSGRAAVTAVAETLRRTNLGDLAEGDAVNLERPMIAGGRFDGHIVQGHIDGTALISTVTPEGDARRVRFATEPDLLRYIAEKGSITIDGASLTVTAVDSEGFELVLIPHTLEVTTFGARGGGDRVNVEVDILAKYVERLLEDRP